MSKLIFKPHWLTEEYFNKLGYVLVPTKEPDGYYKYESSWKLKALHRKGRKHEQLLGDGKRIIFFNCTYSPEEHLVFCAIEEDRGTRKVYNGVIQTLQQLELILNLVE